MACLECLLEALTNKNGHPLSGGQSYLLPPLKRGGFFVVE